MVEVKIQVKESGHWYDQQGNPCYTYKNKKGEEKNTTLREARQFNLVPSVTTIIRMAAAPGLENWKMEQGIFAALTLPRIEGEAECDYVARIKADAKEQAKKAAERGTGIHAYVQMGFEGDLPTTVDESHEAWDYYMAAKTEIYSEVGQQNWLCEKSFACDGYGGKVDLHTPDYVLDIKTTDKPIEGLKLWDEHALQLAAYRHGLGYLAAKCGILYVSTLDKEAKLLWIAEDELQRGLKMFECLKGYYYAKTGL